MSENTFSNIKPFYASPYGHSRLFTALYNGKKVILKTLKESCTADEQCVDALRQEYEITSQLDHRFIRKALGFENVPNLGDCIVFEYVEGKSLAEHVRVGTLDEKQIKNLLVDLCDVLNYMHQHGVCHCDLKPENIMVTAVGQRPRIIDIGLPETEYKTDHELLIKENEFIAPELFKGEEADPRSDIYSLGKIIEFIIERNMLSQYSSVATHCTQFSREQRFDSIQEVKSLITKRTSTAKIVAVVLGVVIVAVLAIVYVPKIIEKTKAEKAERLEQSFHNEIDKIIAERDSLCEKYKIVSAEEPVDLPEAWKEDSLRYRKDLSSYMGVETLRQEAEQTLENQRQAILAKRQSDHNALVEKALQQAADTVARPTL